MLATASQDGTVRIWDTRLHKQLRVLTGQPHSSSDDDDDEAAEVLRVAWQHDQEYLATGGADGWVHIYHYHPSRRTGGGDDDWSLVASIDHGSYLKAAAAAVPSSARGNANNKQEEGDKAEDGTDHAMNDETTDEEEDDHVPPPQEMGPPQIYALQFIKEWPTPDDGDDNANAAESVMYLLTSADDFVILWQLDVTRAKKTTASAVADDDCTRRPIIVKVRPREVFSLHFTALTPTSDGVARGHIGAGRVNWRGRHSGSAATNDANVFGGVARNPNCIIFVFDAAHCAVNGLIGAALSDGSLRLIHHQADDNTVGCAAVLTLPGDDDNDDRTPPVHLTSFCWNSTGQKIATALATGQVVVWSIERSLPDKVWQSSCLATYHGGHAPGRPVFGVRYYAALDDDDDAALLLTWGSDGRLCLWDGGTTMTTTELEIVDAPLVVLLDNAEYPIYGVDIIVDGNRRTGTALDSASATTTTLVAVAGGGAKAGFLGVPVYLQDVIASRPVREPPPPDMSSTTTTTTTTTCRVCPPPI